MIGKIRLLRVKNKNEFVKLKIISVARNTRRRFPVIFALANRNGTWRKKKRILAKKDEVYIFFDSSYSLLRINPRDSISSDIAVAKAIAIISATN